jgi:phosphohistidine phosphatase SixA
MRHAQAPSTLPDASIAEPGNPGHERQLDAAGKASARALGAALRTLSIPVGPIYSSPTYRALETIRLARFGIPKVVEPLAEGGQRMMGAADRANGRWLRRAAERLPPSGSNTLIVTHTPNIVGAFGRDVADIHAAEIIVFEPKTGGRTQLLGRITVEEWQQLARQR